MSKAKPTPGPWTRQDYLHDGATAPIVFIHGRDAAGVVVVAKTHAVDAPLILAAPDLLSALVDLLQAVDAGSLVEARPCPAKLASAREAVAKAKGGA